ncbi:MAG: [protein-PII] uridylyltransferase [Gammaproteobacteria bacterium]|nr:[protein-PII] uridylyltransferase [Gammaproteobacteria bacterium]
MLPAAAQRDSLQLDLSKLDDTLRGGAAPLPAFRSALQEAHEAQRQRFLSGAPVEELLRQRAALLDELLTRAWRLHSPPAQAALVAVGGYGRAELHPGSDIDLLILTAEDSTETQAIERFVHFLWDIGLHVGHSVRTVAQCTEVAAHDITILTNLLEARLVEGSAPLLEAMRAALAPEHLWPADEFFKAKWEEQARRHHKYHDTAYNLEPNIKDGPGGLRDIQTITWVALRHFGSAHLHDLAAHGFLTANELRLLDEGRSFLWRIRYALHLCAGRREDRLLFDYQRALAAQFGYRDTPHQLAVEQFMQRYYRIVMELGRLNEMLLQLFQETILYAREDTEIVPLNKRFQVRNDVIEVAHPGVFKHYPFALLEIFLLLAQRPHLKGVHAATIRLIRDHRYLIDDAFRADLRCRTLFMELLREKRGIAHELRRMHRYGVLGAYIPEFGRIEGQMQHDLFHVYTVDEHTLFLVRNLRRFALPEFAHELPLCSEIFQQLPKPELLYLAGLFHDIAKGRGGDHSELGAEDATQFCLRHGLSAYDAHMVAWLVKHHLILSRTAQREDISDPQVINAFAARIGDSTRLDYLYLLTAADIRATNPGLWTGWKGALLTELYLATRRALARGLENPLAQAERIEETKREARQLLAQHGVDEAALQALWLDAGEDYFLRYSADEIAWHTQSILAAPADKPLTLMRQRSSGGSELFIYTPDRDYLFATITGALDQLGLNVHDARIATTRNGHTLNTFIVLEESGAAIESAARTGEIITALKQQLLQPAAPGAPATRRTRRQLKHFPIPTQITFDQDARNQRTVMEVITADRPGLLAKVGKAFMECGIRLQNAKIATLGARAEDIFYITNRDNQPLDNDRQTQLQTALLHFLEIK